MPANTLLLTLMATDDKPFSKEIVDANNKLLLEYLEKLKKGTTDFDAVKSICNMCNYIYGFNKNKSSLAGTINTPDSHNRSNSHSTVSS